MRHKSFHLQALVSWDYKLDCGRVRVEHLSISYRCIAEHSALISRTKRSLREDNIFRLDSENFSCKHVPQIGVSLLGGKKDPHRSSEIGLTNHPFSHMMLNTQKRQEWGRGWAEAE